MTSSVVILALLAVIGGSHAALITSLPGAPPVTFKQYSGYYTTGAKKNHQLHYWFVESAGNPSTDPVLLWLTGGPGCSGLSALLTEWGPFMVNNDGATLRANPYSWNNNASILTLESPAGVGFSYATDGNIATGDDQTASENWEALVAFFQEFPQYAQNDFYVTGESYGGIYVPTLVQTILDRQSQFHINIKGTAIGNGCVSDNEGTDGLILFQYAHGMIDDTNWQKVKTQCCHNDTDDCPFHSFNLLTFCGNFVEASMNNAWNSGIDAYNMYAPCAHGTTSRFAMEYRNKMKRDYIPTGQASSPPCMDEDPVTNYLNRADVRKALFIPSAAAKWDICNDYINQHYNRQYSDMTPQLKNALNAGLKVMIYSGDVDMACNFLMGQRFSRKLGFAVTKPNHHYMVNGQVGGFMTQYGTNLKFVTVRGAGHMVPTDKPDVAFYIIDAFLNNKVF